MQRRRRWRRRKLTILLPFQVISTFRAPTAGPIAAACLVPQVPRRYLHMYLRRAGLVGAEHVLYSSVSTVGGGDDAYASCRMRVLCNICTYVREYEW